MRDVRSNFRYPSAILAGAVGLWIFGAGLFILRSPTGAFNHDWRSHVQHTGILYNTHRLASPRQGWETYQPPLYYLVNTLLSPNDRSHVFRVRMLSVLYGSLALLLMGRFLSRCDVSPPAQALVLLFIATTPAFLVMFTAYNNDSLATLLSIGILVMAREWIDQGGAWRILLFGILTTAGLYTKLSVVYALAALSAILAFVGLARTIPRGRIFPAIGALGISALLLTPWLVGHNYRQTGQFTPAPADILPLTNEIHLKASPLRTLLTPPGLSPGEWKDPYADLWENTNHKKNSYLAFFFATSVFGEYTFDFLPPIIPWAIFVLHAVFWIAAMVRSRHSRDGPLAWSSIILGMLALATLFFRVPYAGLMDFRYAAWIWLPTAVLYAETLLSSTSLTRSFSWTVVMRSLMICGIVLQGILWLALVVGGKWNFPRL